jgi:hypothetical protein
LDAAAIIGGSSRKEPEALAKSIILGTLLGNIDLWRLASRKWQYQNGKIQQFAHGFILSFTASEASIAPHTPGRRTAIAANADTPDRPHANHHRAARLCLDGAIAVDVEAALGIARRAAFRAILLATRIIGSVNLGLAFLDGLAGREGERQRA